MLLYAIGAFISIIVGGALYNKLGMKRLAIFALILHSIGIVLLALVNKERAICLY